MKIKTINTAKTLNTTEARKAVNLMMNYMVGYFDSFSCNPNKIIKNQFGYYEVAIYIDGKQETASLYRNGSEFVAIADIYVGEKSTYIGSQGTAYTFDDNSNLIVDSTY
jgi:hypothetical protein